MMTSFDPSAGRDLGPGPWAWLVFWGVFGRPGVRTATVLAFDAAEALTLAADEYRDWERPRVALLARQESDQGPVR